MRSSPGELAPDLALTRTLADCLPGGRLAGPLRAYRSLASTQPVARWPEIPLAAGCAIAEGVEAAGPVVARLKWPNDVVVDGRKVAGVLAEGVAAAPPLVILGIGVNVSQPEADWPPHLRNRAASLAALGAPVSRETLLGALL